MNVARPYDNVRVIDLTRDLGCYAARLFADLGADVIRVELPEGRGDRRALPADPRANGIAFEYLNVNKKSVVIDYRQETGRRVLGDLVRTAAIVFYEPEDAETSLLSLLLAQPGARVVTVLSYFGLTGPYAGYTGCDLVAQATGGLAWLSGRPEGAPLRIAGEQSWFVASLYAATSTAMALWDKEQAGASYVLDISAQECIAHSLQNTLEGYTLEHRITRRGGIGTRDATESIFACKDGYIFLAAPLQLTSVWDCLVQWLIEAGHPGSESLTGAEWRELSERVKQKAHDQFRGIFESFAADKTRDELVHEALKRKVVLAPVSKVAETLADPQLVFRNFFRHVRHLDIAKDMVFPGPPYQMSEAVWAIRRMAPKLGQDSDVLTALPPGSREYGHVPMKPDFLKGIRFTDFTWAGAGAFTTKIFSDFGADVIKIETASRPDSVRIAGPFKDGIRGLNRSGYFAARNTGKKSITVDLKNPRGRAILVDLVRQSDVVSNNFAAGAIERLGFGYDDVVKIKHDIVYLAMPMYGETGPRARMPGLGMTISAVSGMTWLTGHAGGPPLGSGTHFPDHAANPNHAAFAVLSALRYRRLTGRGMKIDQSQVELTLNCIGIPFMEYAMTGVEPARIGNRSRFHAPHNIFRCSGDDRWCAIAVLTDAQWFALCNMIGRADLRDDPGLKSADGRLRRIDEVEKAVGDWTAGQEARAVMETLQASGIPAGIVADARDLIDDDPQLRHRGLWQDVDHPEMGTTTYTSPPYRIDGERLTLTRPPLVGEHTDEVLANVLGYTPDQIGSLRESGVLV